MIDITYMFGVSVAELLERAVALREVSGSSPGLDGHKNLCGRRELSDMSY